MKRQESDSISNQRELLHRFIDEREALGGFEIKEYFEMKIAKLIQLKI